MTKTQKIRFIAQFIFVGFLLSISYHLFVGLYLHKPYPYNTFLFRPEDRFADFFDIYNAGMNPYNEIKGGRGIFPLFMLISFLMYIVDHKLVVLVLYIIFYVGSLVIICLYFLRQGSSWLRLGAASVFILCSYPVLFSMDRMNIENGVFLLVFTSIFLFQKKSFVLASLALGVAIAIKPYSIFFLPFFLMEGQVAPALRAVGMACIFSIGALFALPHPVMYEVEILKANLARYNEYYVIKNQGLYFGTSIFGALKVLIYFAGGTLSWFRSTGQVLAFNNLLLGPYFVITNAFFLAIVFLLLFYKTSIWKRIAILAACLALFPYVGSAYRLLYFFIPMFFFICEDMPSQKDKFYAALFSLIMIPTSYLHLNFDAIYLVNPGEVSDSVLFHPLVITILLVSLLLDVLQKRELNDSFQSMLKRLKLFLPPAK